MKNTLNEERMNNSTPTMAVVTRRFRNRSVISGHSGSLVTTCGNDRYLDWWKICIFYLAFIKRCLRVSLSYFLSVFFVLSALKIIDGNITATQPIRMFSTATSLISHRPRYTHIGSPQPNMFFKRAPDSSPFSLCDQPEGFSRQQAYIPWHR